MIRTFRHSGLEAFFTKDDQRKLPLGVSRLSVSELLHEKRALSAEMAVRLSRLLRTTPESWLAMQSAVDVWELRNKREVLESVKPLPARSTHNFRDVYTTDSWDPAARRDDDPEND